MPDWTPTLGAVYRNGATTFRVWAPDFERLDLVVVRDGDDGRVRLHPLGRDDRGYWSARIEGLPAGTRYRYRLDGDAARTFPDPASRFQPEGVHGPSAIVDPAAFAWSDRSGDPPRLEDLVFYELHVGTFTPEGTYRGVIDRLSYLASLGVTAIELMPLADFPGDRNWGYDGAALFAPTHGYGAPDDLRALVDAAHGHGLAIVLDVVYNHFGPDGAYANAFSAHYFTDAHHTPWGRGINLDGPGSREVRHFFIENALHWVHEYRVDGLRLDATHALQDDSPTHFLAELTATVRAQGQRRVLFVAEDHRNLAQPLMPVAAGGFGIDAVWADDFHHQVRVRTAGDREAYYQDFSGSTEDLAATIRQGWFFTGQRSAYLDGPRGTDPAGLSPRQMVICIQNHDQVGNRFDGARLHHEIDAASYRAVTTLLLLAPETPLLFMGQEWATTAPFLFFTDHNQEIGPLVTQGRRDEFSAFDAFSDPANRSRIPDPQSPLTFERSRLDWAEIERNPHAAVLRLYRRLLELRRTARGLRATDRAAYDARAIDTDTVVVQGTVMRAGTRHAADGPDRDGLLSVVRLGPAGAVHLRVVAVGDVTLEHGRPTRTRPRVDVVMTTEDAAFADDPREIRTSASLPGPSMTPALATNAQGGAPQVLDVSIAFERPGAVVLRGVRLV